MNCSGFSLQQYSNQIESKLQNSNQIESLNLKAINRQHRKDKSRSRAIEENMHPN